jgi:hypothetical protein
MLFFIVGKVSLEIKVLRACVSCVHDHLDPFVHTMSKKKKTF